MMDLISFPDYSKVWIYASDKRIPDEVIPDLYSSILDFTKNWTSHQSALKATGGILHNYFIILVVNEYENKPGGCSIDSSVRFIKDLEVKYNVQFFDRQIFHYIKEESIHTIRMDQLSSSYATGLIDDNVRFFDNLLDRKDTFLKSWIKPLRESWQKRFI